MSTEGADPATAGPTAPPKPADSRSEFASDDRSRRRRDDDDDRGRRSRRRDDDDDRDRDRRSRRRDDDDDRDQDRRSRRRDDDDDEDRDRRSRRRNDDDDRDRRRDRDDDDRQRPSRRDDGYDRRRREPDPVALEAQFNRAGLSCLLFFIGGWLQVGAAGLMVFAIFLHWVGVREGLGVFLILSGLLGIGYWLTSATGLGFLISGPRDRGALGLSIATAAVGGLHLILLIVIATSRDAGTFGSPPNPSRSADVSWDAFVTQIRALPCLLFAEIGWGDVQRNIARGSLLPIFANLIEIGRMCLLFLTLRAIMQCARDSDGAKLSMQATVGYAIGAGSLVVVGLLFGLLMLAVRPSNPTDGPETLMAVLHLFFLVLYLVFAGLAVGSTLVIKSVKGRLDYRR